MKCASTVPALCCLILLFGAVACSDGKGSRGVANEARDAGLDAGANADAGAAIDADADSADASSPDAMSADAGRVCFPCQGYWTCGGPHSHIDLTPEADGCFLSGLPERNLLLPDGTITVGGRIVGHASGSGARVSVSGADGGQWLYCAAGGGCHG